MKSASLYSKKHGLKKAIIILHDFTVSFIKLFSGKNFPIMIKCQSLLKSRGTVNNERILTFHIVIFIRHFKIYRVFAAQQIDDLLGDLSTRVIPITIFKYCL